MSPHAFLRYLLLPARPTVLVLIAGLSLGFLVAPYGGLTGMVLALLLLLWLFNYAYVLLEQIANGASEPPVLAVEMLNPINEHRPLLQLAIMLLVYGVLRLLAWYVSPLLAIALGVLAACVLPASIGALGAGDGVLQAVNPRALWQIVRALGPAYAAILAVVLLQGLGLWQLDARSLLPRWLLIPAAQFAALSVYALIGGALYERREALGHEPIDSPERRAARVQLAREQERERFMDTIYGEARGGNQAAAWHSIERELARQQHAFEFYDWMLERLRAMDDPSLARRLAQQYVTRALARDNARVTRLVQRCLADDASFRPRSGAETLRVAELARLAGDRRTARALLVEFPTHFPGDGAIPQAAAMARQLGGDEPPRAA
jgi:hypothetical protein